MKQITSCQVVEASELDDPGNQEEKVLLSLFPGDPVLCLVDARRFTIPAEVVGGRRPSTAPS